MLLTWGAFSLFFGKHLPFVPLCAQGCLPDRNLAFGLQGHCTCALEHCSPKAQGKNLQEAGFPSQPWRKLHLKDWQAGTFRLTLVASKLELSFPFLFGPSEWRVSSHLRTLLHLHGYASLLPTYHAILQTIWMFPEAGSGPGARFYYRSDRKSWGGRVGTGLTGTLQCLVCQFYLVLCFNSLEVNKLLFCTRHPVIHRTPL